MIQSANEIRRYDFFSATGICQIKFGLRVQRHRQFRDQCQFTFHLKTFGCIAIFGYALCRHFLFVQCDFTRNGDFETVEMSICEMKLTKALDEIIAYGRSVNANLLTHPTNQCLLSSSVQTFSAKLAQFANKMQPSRV